MHIDIFHDTVCPWCRIGKQNLYTALEAWEDDTVTLQWRAFLLDPTTPSEGVPFESLASKFGGQSRLDKMHAQVCRAGEMCGLQFKFERISTLPNTILSHQLIQIASGDLQRPLVDFINHAYFEDGRDIGDLDVLIELAEDAGMNPSDTRERLLRQEGLPEVMADLEAGRQMDIHGVPFFIIDHRFGISGAQPPEVFLEAFARAVDEV